MADSTTAPMAAMISAEVLDTLQAVLAADEFRGYASMAANVEEEIRSKIADFVGMLSPAHADAAGRTRAARDALVRFWLAVGLMVAVASVGSFLTWYGTANDLTPFGPAFGGDGRDVAVGFGVVAALGLRIVLEARERFEARDDLARHGRTTSEDLRLTLVEEAVRRSINGQLATAVEVPFVAEAPSLVELDSSRIVPAQALSQVQDFVMGHATSAIGVAGPRGIGKSTILRSLGPDTLDTRFARTLTVQIAAPVVYEPAALIRHIFEEVVLAGLGEADPRQRRWSAANAVARLRFVLGATLIIGGAATVWWAGRTDADVNALEIAGAGIAVAGLVIMYQAWVALWTDWRGARRHLPKTSRKTENAEAIAALERGVSVLRWRSERTTTSALTLKVLGGQIESGDSEAETRRERERSRPELASEFRRVVRDYFQASKRHDRLIVCVDELDKISKPADVVTVINEIKDLMHTRDVHFVVAVSTDAMRSFALRGVPVRDVFDSTFDDIVLVERLSFHESLDVLQARVAGFPVPLCAFCHAWSGGVPRDLIRTARRCRDVQRAAGEHVHLRDLALSVVRSEVTAAVAALFEGNELDESLESVVAGRLRTGTSEAYRDASDLVSSTTSPGARVVAQYLLFAAEVVDVFGQDLAYGEWFTRQADGSLEVDAERLARRRAPSARDRLSMSPG